MSESTSIPKRVCSETGAHLGLSANEEVRTGASCSTCGDTRLESAESLEKTFEAPGWGSTALGSVSVSHAPGSTGFRCLSALLLGLWDGTGGVTLRFSNMAWVIHPYSRSRENKCRLLGSGLAGAKMATSGRFLLVSSRPEACVGACAYEGAFGSKS